MSETRAQSVESGRSWTIPKRDIVVAVMCLALGAWGWSVRGRTWVTAMRPAPDQINDFYQDWGSARNFWVGLPVYTAHSTSIPRHLGLPSNPNLSIEYNAHPPTSVLLTLPLARLDYRDAVLVWNVISLTAILASLAIVAVVLPVPKTVFLPAFALLPFCSPIFGNLQMGQLNLVLVLLVTMAWALERSGRSSTAGLLLGISAAIKLFPAYLAVYYVARGKLRPLLAASLSFLGLTLVTALVLGVDPFHDYLSVVIPRQSLFGGFGYNQSIAGVWRKLFDPTAEVVLAPPLWPSAALARWGTYGSNLLITAIVATLAYRARTVAERDLAFASAVTAMLLVSPVTWDITLVLLLVPIAVVARSAGKSRWMPAALSLILLAVWLPQDALAELTGTDCHFAVCSWTFLLGVPSLKFHALLGTFALELAAFLAEKGEKEPGPSSD